MFAVDDQEKTDDAHPDSVLADKFGDCPEPGAKGVDSVADDGERAVTAPAPGARGDGKNEERPEDRPCHKIGRVPLLGTEHGVEDGENDERDRDQGESTRHQAVIGKFTDQGNPEEVQLSDSRIGREVQEDLLDVDRAVGSDGHGAFHGLLQLINIERPVMVQQGIHQLPGDEGDILLSLPERFQRDHGCGEMPGQERSDRFIRR